MKAGEKGRQFEDEVASVFRRAGFKIQPNTEKQGFEYDFLASASVVGGFDLRIAVECKFRSAAQISNTDMHSFLAAFREAQPSQQFTHGMVVTNTRFSRQAHEAADRHPMVRLMEIDALEDQLLGSRTYLENTERHYRSEGHGELINLSATLHPARDWETNEFVRDVIEFCIAAFRSSDERFIFLLGDFGSGKTTAAEQVHMRLAQSYLEKTTDIFPVILYLKTLQTFDSNEAFIESQLRASAAHLGIGLLESMQGRRPLLFILDGFDEVATNAVPEERMRLLSRIMEIAARANHLMITSRPSYFQNLAGINGLVDELTQRDLRSTATFSLKALYGDRRADGFYQMLRKVGRKARQTDRYRGFPAEQTSLLYLKPLTRHDVIGYLDRYGSILRELYKMSVSQIYDVLDGIYDITNLLTRPLLLRFLVEVLVQGELPLDDPDLAFGSAALYLRYVNMHLDRDWGARQYLTRDQRLAYARVAAVVMLEAGGSLEASSDSIAKVVERGDRIFGSLRATENLDPRRVIADIAVCSFMNVTERDRIEFSHKSFMEFFVADVIMLQLGEQRPVPELRLALNAEILYFIGSFCLNRDAYFFQLMDQLKQFGGDESPRFRSNILVATMYAFSDSADLKLRDLTFSNLRMGKKRFVKCTFSRVRLTGFTLSKVDFEGCRFSETLWAGEFDGVGFRSCRGSLRLSGELHNIGITDCDGIELVHEGAPGRGSAGAMTFDRGTWRGSVVRVNAPQLAASGMGIDRCTLQMGQGSEMRLVMCDLKEVTLEFETIVRMQITKCRLSRTVFRKVLMTPACVKEHQEDLKSCTGVLFVEDPARQSSILFRSGDKGPTYVGWGLAGRLLILNQELISPYESSGHKVKEYLASDDYEDQIWRWAKHLELPLQDPRFRN